MSISENGTRHRADDILRRSIGGLVIQNAVLEAERDRLAEELKRVQEELAAFHVKRDSDVVK